MTFEIQMSEIPFEEKASMMVSFNLDGPAWWIAQDERVWELPKTFSMGAYGLWRGLDRIRKILADLDILATFYVPGWVAETWPAQVCALNEDGHELGHRGYLAERPYDLSPAQQSEVFERTHAIFDELGLPQARGYRANNGNMRAETGELLVRAGYEYSSSLRGDDRPYTWARYGSSARLIEIPVHTELNDAPQFVFSYNPPMPKGLDRIGSIERTFENWQREVDGYAREGLCCVLTLDPQYIGKPGRAARLRQFFQDIIARDDIEFATGSQIAERARAALDAEGVR